MTSQGCVVYAKQLTWIREIKKVGKWVIECSGNIAIRSHLQFLLERQTRLCWFLENIKVVWGNWGEGCHRLYISDVQ